MLLEALAQRGADVSTSSDSIIISNVKYTLCGMGLLHKVFAVASAWVLLIAVFTILSTPTAAQAQPQCIQKTISIADYRPHSAMVGTYTPLAIALTGQCVWSDGSQTGGPEEGAQVWFKEEHNPETFGPYTTDSSGLATGPSIDFDSQGVHHVTVSVVDDTNNQHVTTALTYAVSASGGSTPTATPNTPTATPAGRTATSPTPAARPRVPTPPDSAYTSNLAGHGLVISITHTTSSRGNPLTTVIIRPPSPSSGPSMQITITDESVPTMTEGQTLLTSSVKNLTDNGWTTTKQGTSPNADGSLSYSSWSGQDRQGNSANLWLRGANVTNLDYAMPSQGTPSVIAAIEQTVPAQNGGGMNLGMIAALVAIVAAVALLIWGVLYRRRDH
jgi:hypothetical protein